MISPFVGRILDYYKRATGTESYSMLEDPGVVYVSRIYRYPISHYERNAQTYEHLTAEKPKATLLHQIL